jgi:hypothetical protein
VGTISLVLQYDTTKLFYNGYSSVNPAITTGFFLVNRAGSRITLSCATMTAINITSGTLVNYHFIARTNGTSTLTWDTQNAGNCEYSDISGIVLYATYNNGSVSFLSNVLLVNAGPDLTVPSGGSVTFTAGTSGGVTPLTYNWTPSTGLNNASLLNPVASPTVTTTYRLTVTGSNGCSTWDEMTVTVLPPVVPENLMVETTTVTDGMTACFNATQTVTLAGDEKLFTVANGGHADVIAGQRIWLKPGTRVEMGGHFAAWITSSGTYCNTSPGMKTVINDEFTEITGTSGVRDHSRLILWPVPADEKIYIDLSEEIFASTVKIRIISLTGKILTDQLFSDLKKLTIDVSDMKAGVYILSVGHLHGTEIRKIVVR